MEKEAVKRNFSSQGKKNRAAGQRFEAKVRQDLIEKGWIVDRWGNNVELSPMQANPRNEIFYGELVPAKHKFCGVGRPMAIGTGFPDFIAFKIRVPSTPPLDYCACNKIKFGEDRIIDYHIIGVEVKSNGYLDKVEKEKCKWLLDNNVFSKILIASKSKKRGEIIYKDFKELKNGFK